MVIEILRPATVQEALRAGALPGAAYLGGGTWLNSRPSAEPLTLVSLEKLGLDSIRTAGGRCVLGATVTFQQCLDDGSTPLAIRRAVSLTASRTLRNMKTIGGEIAHHPADSALVPLLAAMDAQLAVAGKKRPVPVDEYAGGLILSVAVRDPGRPASVVALARTSHSPRSLVVAACAEAASPRLSGLRIVVSDCSGSLTRAVKLESRLEGSALPARSEIEQACGNELSPRPDIHASSRYKAYMARVLVADALGELP